MIVIVNAACISLELNDHNHLRHTRAAPVECLAGGFRRLPLHDQDVLLCKLKGGQPRPTISLAVNAEREASLC